MGKINKWEAKMNRILALPDEVSKDWGNGVFWANPRSHLVKDKV